jgi:hypothetical protein
MLDDQSAQIIDAVGMVGVRMRVENGVDTRHLSVDQLLAQIRTRVDKDLGRLGLRRAWLAVAKQDRAPTSAIFRIFRVTFAPTLANPRHAAR